MHERARIARYFAPLTAAEAGSLTLTDDAAILTPPAGQRLVVTTDSVIEGIHVLPHATAEQFARKLVRRNLSDLAAMGAHAWRYSLNLHTPHGLPDRWFGDFAAALAAEQETFGICLIGGDSTSAAHTPIHCTLTCFGLLAGAPLLRSTARPGDDLYVSGTIGDAALGLTLLQHHVHHNTAIDSIITRYHTPEPRLALGQALGGIATAAIDISDGLLTDITQLCRASGVGASVERASIPHSPEMAYFLSQDEVNWESFLNGGDDYELCFTAPAALRNQLIALGMKLRLPLTRIGTITEGSAVILHDAQGNPVTFHEGWEHR